MSHSHSLFTLVLLSCEPSSLSLRGSRGSIARDSLDQREKNVPSLLPLFLPLSRIRAIVTLPHIDFLSARIDVYEEPAAACRFLVVVPRDPRASLSSALADPTRSRTRIWKNNDRAIRD